MSYDIHYTDKQGQQYELKEPMEEGGTHQLGGNTETWLNVTYNYSWYYHMFLDEEEGIRWLYGKTGGECVERLKEAIEPFEGFMPYERDYWAPTPGNCVQPLRIFLQWAQRWPDGRFEGD